MNRLLIFALLLCVLVPSSFSTQTTASKAFRKQRAVTEFNPAVHVHGKLLEPGRYLIVHDDAAMQRGEACTYIYKGDAEISSKLVVSFHCTPMERPKARYFVFRTMETASGTLELREIQFAGDTEAHLVPTN